MIIIIITIISAIIMIIIMNMIIIISSIAKIMIRIGVAGPDARSGRSDAH